MRKIDLIASKIFTWDSIRRQCAVWRFQDQRIVFTNGCFDILHLGHVEYLSEASDLGGALIVGLNSDSSIKRIKGPGRPINDEHARAMVLASLSYVDAVVLFNEDTPYELIRTIRPDVLVKGSDYSVEEISGHDVVLANGGQVITIELTRGYSTSLIVEQIIRRHKNNDS